MSRAHLFALTFATASSAVVGVWMGVTVTIIRVNEVGLEAVCEGQAFSIIRCEMLGNNGGQP